MRPTPLTPFPRAQLGITVRGLSVLALTVVIAIGGAAGLSLPSAAGAAFQKAMWGPVTFGGATQFPLYRDLGVGIYETQINWRSVALSRPRRPADPADPAYDWSAVDQPITEAQHNGFRVAIMLVGAPPWANGNHAWNWAPRRTADFADFATAAARRYPGVHLWMIWGEPSRGHNFQPLTPARPGARLNSAQARAPRTYARLLDASYAALKRVSRRNLVVGGMTFTTGDIATPQWIQNMRLPGGRRPRMDLYGHNPFSFREPNFRNPPSPNSQVDFSDLPRLARWVDRYLSRSRRQHMPLFLSEWTIPTDRLDSEFNFFVTRAVQARWISQGLRISRRWSRIYALGWIHVYDDSASSAGLLDAGGVKKPGYDAFKLG